MFKLKLWNIFTIIISKNLEWRSQCSRCCSTRRQTPPHYCWRTLLLTLTFRLSRTKTFRQARYCPWRLFSRFLKNIFKLKLWNIFFTIISKNLEWRSPQCSRCCSSARRQTPPHCCWTLLLLTVSLHLMYSRIWTFHRDWYYPWRLFSRFLKNIFKLKNCEIFFL